MSNQPKPDHNQNDARGLAAIAKAIRDHATLTRPDAQTKLEAREKKLFRLQVATVAVAAIYATLTWCLLHTGNEELRVARDGLQAANRAWVQYKVNDDWIPKQLATMTKWNFVTDVLNSGKTPARNVHIDWKVEPLEAEQAPSLNYMGAGNTTIGILFPDKPISDLAIRTNPDSSIASVTEDQRKLLGARKLYFSVFARISYDDEFGRHWTHYCWWMGFPPAKDAPPAMFASRSCVEYNDAGDGEDPTRKR
jgi:hypothetical protein